MLLPKYCNLIIQLGIANVFFERNIRVPYPQTAQLWAKWERKKDVTLPIKTDLKFETEHT